MLQNCRKLKTHHTLPSTENAFPGTFFTRNYFYGDLFSRNFSHVPYFKIVHALWYEPLFKFSNYEIIFLSTSSTWVIGKSIYRCNQWHIGERYSPIRPHTVYITIWLVIYFSCVQSLRGGHCGQHLLVYYIEWICRVWVKYRQCAIAEVPAGEPY